MKSETLLTRLGVLFVILGLGGAVVTAQSVNNEICAGPASNVCTAYTCYDAGGSGNTCDSTVPGSPGPITYNRMTIDPHLAGTCQPNMGTNCCDYGVTCTTHYYIVIEGKTCDSTTECCNTYPYLANGC